MYHSSNYIVRTVFNNALYSSNSCIGYTYIFSRVKATGTYNNIAHSAAIDNVLTLLHVRSDIS